MLSDEDLNRMTLMKGGSVGVVVNFYEPVGLDNLPVEIDDELFPTKEMPIFPWVLVCEETLSSLFGGVIGGTVRDDDVRTLDLPTRMYSAYESVVTTVEVMANQLIDDRYVDSEHREKLFFSWWFPEPDGREGLDERGCSIEEACRRDLLASMLSTEISMSYSAERAADHFENIGLNGLSLVPATGGQDDEGRVILRLPTDDYCSLAVASTRFRYGRQHWLCRRLGTMAEPARNAANDVEGAGDE